MYIPIYTDIHTYYTDIHAYYMRSCESMPGLGHKEVYIDAYTDIYTYIPTVPIYIPTKY